MDARDLRSPPGCAAYQPKGLYDGATQHLTGSNCSMAAHSGTDAMDLGLNRLFDHLWI